MPVNPDAVGTTSEPVESHWSSKDCLLYALGVGAGTEELAFTTENTMNTPQQVLPTFAVVAGGIGGGLGAVGQIDLTKLVHGEQAFEVFGPLPVEATVSTTTTVAGVYDKGSGALIVTESVSVDAKSRKRLFTNRSSAFVRGEGGFGGERGPSGPRNVPPERPADHVVTYTTRPDQALLYRLSGDRNPLHSDPAFAALAGFDRPILHGLCTFGFTGRALLHSLCDSDVARFHAMEARFRAPVYPGDTLKVSIWVTGEGAAVYQTETQRGEVVIDTGSCRFA